MYQINLFYKLILISCFLIVINSYAENYAQEEGIIEKITEENSIKKNQKSQYTFAAVLTEKKSGEYIISQNVYLYLDSNIQNKPVAGGKSNKFGFVSIPNLEQNTYYVVIKSIFYNEYSNYIEIGENKINKIELENKSIQTGETTVIADKSSVASNKISTIDIKPDFISKMPSIGGEVDVFRVLQLLPGVKQNTELSSGLYVRGGSPDQNLTLLDGVVVYNPSHLGGFLSTFNADALRDIQLIKGAFPAQYGGRLSSVLDITMKEGTKEELGGSAGISLIASRLTLEGPIDENSTFMISGRRMYLDLLLAAAPDEGNAPQYYFYDLNAKLNYKLSPNDRIFGSAYFGRDVFDANTGSESNSNSEEGFNMGWGNSTANLRWMHIVSPEMFTNFSLIYTNYKFFSDLTDKDGKSVFGTDNQINDFMLRAEAENYLDSSHTIKFGLEATNHRFTSRSGIDIFNEIPNDVLDALGLSEQTLSVVEAGLYAQDEWKATENLFLNLGGRLAYFNEGNYLRFEPRLISIYKIQSNTNIKASVAYVNQFLHLVTRNDINLPTDLWLPSSKNLTPSNSWQGVLGMEHTFDEGEYLFTAETYYRTMSNIYEYKDSASFSFGLPLESQLTAGNGDGYGLELFFNKRAGDLQGWIGYTLAKTSRTFADLNNGKTFSPRYDTRHDVSVVLTYTLSDSWELGATWVYTTGQAYTMPNGSYTGLSSGIGQYSNGRTGQGSRDPNMLNRRFDDTYNFSDRNAYRLPAYHKMDINMMHKFKMFGLESIFSINVYNLYNRRNAFAMYVSNDYDDNTNETTKKVKMITLFPIIPTIGLSFKF